MHDDDEGAYLVGQALGYLHVGQQTPGVVQRVRREVRQLDPQQAIERAGRLVGRAFQLYMQGGLSKNDAARRISNLALTFGSLE